MAEPFRFDVELSVRYRDLDTQKHVNNTVFGTYLKQARIKYFDHVLDVDFEGQEIALANVEIDFHRPITYDDESVRIECAIVEVGESSVRMRYRVYAGGSEEPAATGESVQVIWDGESPRPVPDAWREQFREYEPSL